VKTQENTAEDPDDPDPADEGNIQMDYYSTKSIKHQQMHEEFVHLLVFNVFCII
jgi:hypothetical protein